MDFAARPRSVAPTQPQQPPPMMPPKTGKKSGIYIWIIIIVIVILGSMGIWQLAKPKSVTSTKPPQPVVSGQNDIISSSTKPLVVELYDSGAGSLAMGKLTNILQGSNYKVKDMGASQFDYDATMIWYNKTEITQAQNLAALIADRKVTLKETSIDGTFDLIVFLGKS